MVYCSFGINVHTTRCFNWISVGYFDEYIWIRKQGDTEWKRFESYKPISEQIEEIPLGIYRSEPSVKLVNSVYARISGRFPGDNSYYTAHKCILKGLSSGTYEYVVGRSLITKDPDLQHISEIQTFIVYPQNTPIKVYHITDQQGFYWMEYQTWAGSAQAILNKIQDDQSKSSFIPIIINTGDVTQNGTRVNEWLDYYNAGKCLFSKYEHMSVVGNNDLCGTDPTILGTGDDVGKSNGFYHHVFNCYEINTESLVINNKYVPSTYYFDCLYTNYKIRFVNVNSEITFINCRDWFGLGTDNTDVAYNIYTGWTTGNASEVESPIYKSATSDFTPIYNTLYTFPTIFSAEAEIVFSK